MPAEGARLDCNGGAAGTAATISLTDGDEPTPATARFAQLREIHKTAKAL